MGKSKHKITVQEELEALSPGLAKLKKQGTPVDLPPGYFDQLSDSIMQRIAQEQATPKADPAADRQPWWIFLERFLPRPAYAMALAAGLVLLVSIGILRSINQPGSTTPELALSDADINDYINYHIDDFDLGLLAEEASDTPQEAPLMLEEDSLDQEEMDAYFDEWLDEIDLEELL